MKTLPPRSTGPRSNSLRVEASVYCPREFCQLERDWQALEPLAANSFFISWPWISCWLVSFEPENLAIYRFFDCGSLIGIGLFSTRIDHRRGVFRSRVLRLHQTGDPDDDQVWVEYNGFLVHREYRERVHQAFWEFLSSEAPNWDEVFFAGFSAEDRESLVERAGLPAVEHHQSPCLGVDLTQFASDDDYLASLSKSTRWRVRRSLRGLEALGDLAIKEASSVEQSLELFAQAGELHLEKWGSESGFNNQKFVGFHRKLIEANFSSGKVRLFGLRSNGELLGSFYFFFYEGTVYFYLCGLKKFEDNNLRPGLVGHYMIIREFIKEGAAYYDFMAGEEQYKRSLGSVRETLHWFFLQRPKMKFQIENGLVALKQRVLG